jgi:hypothetical protein
MDLVCLNKAQKKFLFWALIFSLLLVPLLAGAHHHEDGKVHKDCPVCTFVYVNIATTSQLVFLIIILIVVFHILLSLNHCFIPKGHFAHPIPRAPPFLILVS